MKKYSATTGGFYDDKIHHGSIPDDAVDVSDDQYQNWSRGGKEIVISQGALSVVDGFAKANTEADIVAEYEGKLDTYLDSVAQSYRYADRTRLALRAAYPNQHQALALSFGTWMDACNDLAKQCYLDVKDGKRAMPSLDEFMAMLPEFVPPVSQ